jgi:hypothetical protein
MIVCFTLKGFIMSFNKMSASQAAPSNDKPDDKTSATPTVVEPAAQPAKTEGEAAPAQKS